MTPELEYRLTVLNVLKATGIQDTPLAKAKLLIFAAMVVLKENGVEYNGPRLIREAEAQYAKVLEDVIAFEAGGVDKARVNPDAGPAREN